MRATLGFKNDLNQFAINFISVVRKSGWGAPTRIRIGTKCVGKDPERYDPDTVLLTQWRPLGEKVDGKSYSIYGIRLSPPRHTTGAEGGSFGRRRNTRMSTMSVHPVAFSHETRFRAAGRPLRYSHLRRRQAASLFALEPFPSELHSYLHVLAGRA